MNVVLATNNLNVRETDIIFWGSKRHAEFINDAGYDGMEYHPTRSRLALEIFGGIDGATDSITSLHQGFRSERIRDIVSWPPSKAIKNLALVGGFSNAIHSIAHLELVQQKSKRTYPIVLYPETPLTPPHNRGLDVHNLGSSLSPRLFQPTPEILDFWGIEKGPEMVNSLQSAMSRHGFDGICIDTFHWRMEQGGKTLPKWENAFGQFVNRRLVKEIHIGLARGDCGDTSDDYKKIISGNGSRCETGEMLLLLTNLLHKNKQNIHAVVEMPARYVEYSDLASFHRHLVLAMRQLITSQIE